MDSPQNVGDTTANSISNQLSGTHLNRHKSAFKSAAGAIPKAVSSALYSGQKFIQLQVAVAGSSRTLMVLRRVQDSYVNVSQMLEILVLLSLFSEDQVQGFLANEVFSSTQYLSQGGVNHMPMFNDFRKHDVAQVRGLWIPFDKAVSIAVKFDLYDTVKRLFLVDVHDVDKLPKVENAGTDDQAVDSQKRPNDDDDAMDSMVADSPSKKRKTVGSTAGSTVDSASLSKIVANAAAANSNSPYTLPSLTFPEKDMELVVEAKQVFSEIFKNDAKDSLLLTKNEVAAHFKRVFDKCPPHTSNYLSLLDVPLDPLGKSALHYAATLASVNLVSSFIELTICSPVRGDNKGESPLISTIQVTNAMEKGNFMEMLQDWLWPNLWLFDNKHNSVLHFLIKLAVKNYKSSKFYFEKILEWTVSNPDKHNSLESLCSKIINAQESQNGNSPLHLAGENELKWFIFILLELNADLDLPNNTGVKPLDFECVRQIAELRENYHKNLTSPTAVNTLLTALGSTSESDEYLILLVKTGLEFLKKVSKYSEVGVLETVNETEPKEKELTPTSEVESSSLLLNKIFKSIQDLLGNTNEEYEKVIHQKKIEINNLNKELRDATIITANNRFISKKISERISLVDTMKLQMTNINDKLQMLKKDLSGKTENEALFNDEIDDSTLKFDADEPFIIRPIYEKIANNEPVEATAEIVQALPSTEILRARLRAYHEVNSNLQSELDNLLDYNALTAKFKKVVSFCTGVDINEVDELLDGLLEAVEGQQ